MQYEVILERGEGSFRVIVPSLPGVRAAGPTRDAALAAIRREIETELSRVEVTRVEIGGPPAGIGYSPEEVALARKAARLRGEPDAPLTGKPWLDFAGSLADLPDEDWEIYEAAVRQAREDANREDWLP